MLTILLSAVLFAVFDGCMLLVLRPFIKQKQRYRHSSACATCAKVHSRRRLTAPSPSESYGTSLHKGAIAVDGAVSRKTGAIRPGTRDLFISNQVQTELYAAKNSRRERTTSATRKTKAAQFKGRRHRYSTFGTGLN